MLKTLLKRAFIYIVILLVLALVFGGFFIWRELGKSPSKGALMSFERYDYFKNGAFTNLENIEPKSAFKDLYSVFSHYFSTDTAPVSPLPLNRLLKSDFSSSPADFGLYWLGHASLLAEIDGARVLVDPVFGSASPLPFVLRRLTPAPLDAKNLPKIDILLITHDHYDHLEKHTIQTTFARHYIVPLGLKDMLVGWGVDENKITELGWWQSTEIMGLKITATPSLHGSGRSLLARNESLWVSYAVESGRKKIFFGADSGYGAHFASIGERFGGFDIACLGISGTLGSLHLEPSTALKAAKELGAKALLPVHWGTFNQDLKPWSESIEQLYTSKGEQSVLTPLLGQRFDEKTQTKPWWRVVR